MNADESRFYAREKAGHWWVMVRTNGGGDRQVAQCRTQTTAKRVARALDAPRVREAPRGRVPDTGRLRG